MDISVDNVLAYIFHSMISRFGHYIYVFIYILYIYIQPSVGQVLYFIGFIFFVGVRI